MAAEWYSISVPTRVCVGSGEFHSVVVWLCVCVCAHVCYRVMMLPSSLILSWLLLVWAGLPN